MIRARDTEGYLPEISAMGKAHVASHLDRKFPSGKDGAPNIIIPAGANPEHTYPIGLRQDPNTINESMDSVQTTTHTSKQTRYDLPPTGSNHDGHSLPFDMKSHQITPKGLRTLKPALSVDEYLITRVTSVPVSGQTARPGGKITIPVHLTSPDQILLPCFGLAFSFRSTGETPGENSVFLDNGSWIFFRETRTFINGVILEQLEHANVYHSFDVFRNRRDTAMTGSYNDTEFNYFSPLFRSYNPTNIRTTQNEFSQTSDPLSFFYELNNPITRSGQPFPGNWFNSQLRFELDLAPLSDYTAEINNSLNPLLWFEPQLYNIRFVYYVVEKYSPDVKLFMQANGYVLPMTHILFKEFHGGSIVRHILRFPIEESVACLNTIIMLPFGASFQQGDGNYTKFGDLPQRDRNRLTRYFPNSTMLLESVQWFIGGKRQPLHKLWLTRDREGLAFEYMVRWGEIGPHKRLDMYQGVFNGFNDFPVLLIPLTCNSFQSDYVASGIDTRNLANQVVVEIRRPQDFDQVNFFMFLQCTGLLFMTLKNGPQWYR